MIALAIAGASATLPRPTMPSSVSISTTVHEWKRKVLMVSAGEYSRSMALEQKLPCGGTVLPFHWKTRARTDLIFMGCLSRKSSGSHQGVLAVCGAHAGCDAEGLPGRVDAGRALARDVV